MTILYASPCLMEVYYKSTALYNVLDYFRSVIGSEIVSSSVDKVCCSARVNTDHR